MCVEGVISAPLHLRMKSVLADQPERLHFEVQWGGNLEVQAWVQVCSPPVRQRQRRRRVHEERSGAAQLEVVPGSGTIGHHGELSGSCRCGGGSTGVVTCRRGFGSEDVEGGQAVAGFRVFAQHVAPDLGEEGVGCDNHTAIASSWGERGGGAPGSSLMRRIWGEGRGASELCL